MKPTNLRRSGSVPGRSPPRRRSCRRRAAVVVQVAVFATLMLGLGALVVDMGAVYTAHTELQRAADSSALAAAARLAGNGVDSPDALARATADEYARRNPVAGVATGVEASDVVFGRSEFIPGTGKFTFEPGGDAYDAVRVTVRRTEGSAAGPLPLMFAHIYGFATQGLVASATAVLIPRDIAVVIDLSGSMNDDSELQHCKPFLSEDGEWRDGVDVNLRDIWCALDGPAPSYPYVPAPEPETEYAGDTGPPIGAMDTWGTPLVTETYDPTTDPGLWLIPPGVTCTEAAAAASLAARGYSADEIACLMDGSHDDSYSSQWVNRTAAILGLVTWRSGRPGGRPGGDGDALVEGSPGSELTQTPFPFFRAAGGWTWANYVNYVGGSNAMTATVADLRYRFGLKTFINFLLEERPAVNRTHILWQTPGQPLQAVKDAVRAMTDVITSLDSLDQMSLEIFATKARHQVDLTLDLEKVPETLHHRQAAHFDSTTNIGGGLLAAMDELASDRAHGCSAKVIVLMSDGKPNVDEYGQYVEGGSAAINNWVIGLAQQARDRGIRIYTVSVGCDVDQNLMQAIATQGAGQHFHAEGTPEQYAAQLELIFRTLGGKRPVALIE